MNVVYMSLIHAVACRVEYAKAHARARRYAEEEELVLEEMRRTIKYLEWKASWWLCLRPPLTEVYIEEGRRAYAEKQTAMLRHLADKFKNIWKPILRDAGAAVDGIEY